MNRNVSRINEMGVYQIRYSLACFYQIYIADQWVICFRTSEFATKHQRRFAKSKGIIMKWGCEFFCTLELEICLYIMHYFSHCKLTRQNQDVFYFQTFCTIPCNLMLFTVTSVHSDILLKYDLLLNQKLFRFVIFTIPEITAKNFRLED